MHRAQGNGRGLRLLPRQNKGIRRVAGGGAALGHLDDDGIADGEFLPQRCQIDEVPAVRNVDAAVGILAAVGGNDPGDTGDRMGDGEQRDDLLGGQAQPPQVDLAQAVSGSVRDILHGQGQIGQLVADPGNQIHLGEGQLHAEAAVAVEGDGVGRDHILELGGGVVLDGAGIQLEAVEEALVPEAAHHRDSLAAADHEADRILKVLRGGIEAQTGALIQVVNLVIRGVEPDPHGVDMVRLELMDGTAQGIEAEVRACGLVHPVDAGEIRVREILAVVAVDLEPQRLGLLRKQLEAQIVGQTPVVDEAALVAADEAALRDLIGQRLFGKGITEQ